MNQKPDNCLGEWNTFAKGVQRKYADKERKKYSQYPGQPMDKFLVHEFLRNSHTQDSPSIII